MGTSEECAAAAALAFRHICDGIVDSCLSVFVYFLFSVWCWPLGMSVSYLGEVTKNILCKQGEDEWLHSKW